MVHAPPGFDPSRPFHVVLFAHSFGSTRCYTPRVSSSGPWLAVGPYALTTRAAP